MDEQCYYQSDFPSAGHQGLILFGGYFFTESVDEGRGKPSEADRH